MAAALMLPDTPLETKTGEKVVAGEALKGKVVALYFSAHWCPPCRGFTPKLAAAYEMANEDEKKFDAMKMIHEEECQGMYHGQSQGSPVQSEKEVREEQYTLPAEAKAEVYSQQPKRTQL